jgi:hypothetical protein
VGLDNTDLVERKGRMSSIELKPGTIRDVYRRIGTQRQNLKQKIALVNGMAEAVQAEFKGTGMIKIIRDQFVAEICAKNVTRIANAQAEIAASVNASGKLHSPNSRLLKIGILGLHRHSLLARGNRWGNWNGAGRAGGLQLLNGDLQGRGRLEPRRKAAEKPIVL